MHLVSGRVNTTQNIYGCDDGACIQWNFRQRNDCDAQRHDNGEGFRVAGRLEDVGCDRFLDCVAEHQDAHNGQASI